MRSCSSAGGVGLDEAEHLDLVELVHAEDAARVLAGRAGLAPEAAARSRRSAAAARRRRGSRRRAARRARPRRCRPGTGRPRAGRRSAARCRAESRCRRAPARARAPAGSPARSPRRRASRAPSARARARAAPGRRAGRRSASPTAARRAPCRSAAPASSRWSRPLGSPSPTSRTTVSWSGAASDGQVGQRGQRGVALGDAPRVSSSTARGRAPPAPRAARAARALGAPLQRVAGRVLLGAQLLELGWSARASARRARAPGRPPPPRPPRAGQRRAHGVGVAADQPDVEHGRASATGAGSLAVGRQLAERPSIRTG